MSTKSRAIDWLKQAQNDLSWSKLGLENKFYSQSCFTAQQAGEKAIKSIAYYLEYEVRGHSITKITQALKINGEIEEAGKFLDLFYICYHKYMLYCSVLLWRKPSPFGVMKTLNSRQCVVNFLFY